MTGKITSNVSIHYLKSSQKKKIPGGPWRKFEGAND